MTMRNVFRNSHATSPAKLLMIAFLGLLLGTTTAPAPPPSLCSSFDLKIEVGYAGFPDEGIPGPVSSSGIYDASGGDSSFVTIQNVGSSAFVGTLSLTGTASNPVNDVNDTSGVITLNPGDSWTLVGGPEASNQGG